MAIVKRLIKRRTFIFNIRPVIYKIIVRTTSLITTVVITITTTIIIGIRCLKINKLISPPPSSLAGRRACYISPSFSFLSAALPILLVITIIIIIPVTTAGVNAVIIISSSTFLAFYTGYAQLQCL